MKYSHRLHLNAAAIAVLAAVAASSTAAADTVSTETVKVTASRVEQELLEVPMSVAVVSEDDVRHANATTLASLLQDIPGIQVQNSGSQGLKRISIRGEDSFRTLILVDGQKISEQKSMSGTAILIDPANIERIEVIKGPASVLYGSDAIGGAINIITKKGGKKAFEADGSVAWNGAGHGWSESLSLGGKVGRFQYRLSGAYQSENDLDTPEGRLPHTAFRTKSAGAFLSYDITDNVTAGIQADSFDSHLRSGSVTYDEDAFYVDIPKWKRNKVGVFVDAKNISDFLARVRWDAYWQKTEKAMVNHVEDSGVLQHSVADNRLTTLGTSLQADWQLGDNHYLITGYEYSQDKLKANTNLHMQMNMMGMMGMNYTTDRYNEGKQSSHAVFASMESQLPQNFIANYGVRYTYVDSEMTAATASKNGQSISMTSSGLSPVNYVNVDDGSAGQTGSNHNDRFVFNAGITWTGIENLALRATWAQGFRAPLLQEKYLQNNMGGGAIYGNPDLTPEKSNNFELGARFNNGVTNADITVFYSLADDYITTETLDTKTSRYINADKAKTFGLEASVSHTILGHWTPYFSVTALRRKLEKDNYSTYESGTPTFYARYGLKTEHELFGGVLNTDTYARSQNATKSYSYSTKSTTAIAGFTTLNFGAGYRFGKNGNYSIDAEFLNILNQRYQYNTTSYEPGRHFNVKLTAHY